MKKLLLAFGAIITSITMFAQSPGMLLRHTEVVGDALGEQSGVTQWTKLFYDKDGKVIREGVYGKGLDESIQITRYTTNEYNEKGQIVRKSSQQYGMFDGEDLAFKAANDTTVYSYNDKGLLIAEETQRFERKEYSYDNSGNLLKKVRKSLNDSEWIVSETTEYSDFVNGQPTKLVNTGRWEVYNYVGEYVYDAKGNKLKELHYNNWTDKKLVGNSFYWTYDEDGFCTMYEKKYINSNGEEVDNMRTLYRKLESPEGVERIEAVSQTYSTSAAGEEGTWYKEPTYNIREYAKYNHADCAPEVKAEKIGDENKIKIAVTLPKQAATDGDNAGIKVMANGIIVDFVTVGQARSNGMLSADGKTITFTTEIMKNGQYEILAQYVKAKGDNPDVNETEEWNVSNIANVTLDKELPKPSNIRGISADKNEQGLYSLTIEWDAAPNAEAYGLKRYNVLMQNFSVADNREAEDNGLGLTWTFENLSGPVTFMVQAVYPYGKANSEYVTINPKDLVQIVDDNRICVEEERTYVAGNTAGVDAGAKFVEKYFVNANDTITRSAMYSEVGGKLVLESYSKYAYNGNTLTVTTNDESQVRTNTYNEQGKLATVTLDSQEGSSKYQYVVTYSYSEKDGRLETETIKRAKYKSNGSLGAASVYSQTTYTNDPDNDGIVYGVYSTYDAMKAKWTECAQIKRYMMPAHSKYSPTASALEVTNTSVVISAMPQYEWRSGIAGFNIYRDGEIIAQGVSFFDENHLKESETGELLDWNYTDLAPEGKSQCEYIVQYVTLDMDMNYVRGYASSEPFVADFANASGICMPKVNAEKQSLESLFNLAGQKVSKNYRGIIINNGKKYINKYHN